MSFLLPLLVHAAVGPSYLLKAHTLSPAGITEEQLNGSKETVIRMRGTVQNNYEYRSIEDKVDLQFAMGQGPEKSIYFEISTLGMFTKKRDLRTGVLTTTTKPTSFNKMVFSHKQLEQWREMAKNKPSVDPEEPPEFNFSFTSTDLELPEIPIQPGYRWEKKEGITVSKFLFKGVVIRGGKRYLEVSEERKLGPVDDSEAWFSGTVLFDELDGTMLSMDYRSIKFVGERFDTATEEDEDDEAEIEAKKAQGRLKSMSVKFLFIPKVAKVVEPSGS